MAEQQPAPFFIGYDLALDFLDSVAAPWGQKIEWFGNGGDFVSWLEQARAVPADVAVHFRTDANLRALDAVASQARELREWFRTFVSDHAGKPLDPASLNELAPLNQLLGRDESYPQPALRSPPAAEAIDGDRHGALHWQHRRHWRTPQALLLPILDPLRALLSPHYFTLLPTSQSPNCPLCFSHACT